MEKDQTDRDVAKPSEETLELDDIEAEIVSEAGPVQGEAEAAELRDRLLRTLADFDNFRKRTERERRELHRYAATEILRSFLEVVDNLDRAVAADGSLHDLKTGVEMILRQMKDLLRRSGVREVEGTGTPFDPSVHEAVARQEDPEVEEPTVREEFQRGYMIHDRLLRPAIVRVAVPPERREESAETEADEVDGDADSAGGMDSEGSEASVASKGLASEAE